MRGARAQIASIPAPVGGWDAFSPLDGMPPQNAVRLDNFFPETARIKLRRGHAVHATEVASSTAAVETLMEYSGLSGNKLFAIASTAVYEVTTSGTASSSLTGLSNARWQHTVFTPSGGTPTLIMCNGADAPRQYAGATWSTCNISVSAGSTGELIHVTSHANRLWWVRKDSMDAFYSADAGALSGQMTQLNFGPNYSRGGYLVAIGSWSRDGGDGPDDLLAAITSNGEVAVYSGTDPSSSTDWAKIGVFTIGRPIGRRPLINFGGDLVVITESGFESLNTILPSAQINAREQALSGRIAKAVNDAARDAVTFFGWSAVFYPKGTQLIFNIPVKEGKTWHQYAMNTITGAWCRYVGMNAACWATLGNDLYFGGKDGKVYRADTGTSDNGTAIRGDVRTAFNRFGDPRKKKFNVIRPQITSDGSPDVAVGLNVDFADRSPASIPTAASGAGATWDAAVWDDAEWAGGEQIVTPWLNVQGIGHTASFALRVEVTDIEVGLNAVDIVYEPGEFI